MVQADFVRFVQNFLCLTGQILLQECDSFFRLRAREKEMSLG